MRVRCPGVSWEPQDHLIPGFYLWDVVFVMLLRSMAQTSSAHAPQVPIPQFQPPLQDGTTAVALAREYNKSAVVSLLEERTEA